MLVHRTPLNLFSSTTVAPPLTLLPQFSTLSITIHNRRPPSTIIRMGGGPRTFPGGVSKWQWKRMQASKSKQLLKARLARERHIYEMRKRAELKAAVSELERPWEIVKKVDVSSSSLFSVAADEQLKVLADRFQKPGGFDMWTDHDGPQLFVTPEEGLPTARFFPKGVVHSIRPYGKIDHGNIGDSSADESLDFVGPKSGGRTSSIKRKNGHRKRIGSASSDDGNSQLLISKLSSNVENRSDKRGDGWSGGVSRMDGVQEKFGNESDSRRKSMNLRQGSRGLERGNRSSKMRRDGSKSSSRGPNLGRGRGVNSEDVYDMSMQDDGNYGFSGNDQDGRIRSRVYENKMIKSNFRELDERRQ